MNFIMTIPQLKHVCPAEDRYSLLRGSIEFSFALTRKIFALLVLGACLHTSARAQSAAQLPDAPAPAAPTVRNFPRNFLHDQGAIWTSPFRARGGAAVAGLFLIASAGVLGSDDANIMQHHFLSQSTANHANTASTGLTGLLVAAPVAYFGIGHLSHNPDFEETGALAGEAMVDSLAVNEVFKIASRRERPTLDDAKGRFFQPGIGFDSSFASNHSVIAWSSATVLASRSDHLLVKIAAYGLAGGVSASRIVGRDHFPSDVYVGSAVGWLIGRYVWYRHTRTRY
jgi:membrane-associated phospholipid phosphatase